MKKLYGVTTPIVTPFDKHGALDEASLASLTEHVICGGLQCVYPCGTTGEMMLLTRAERMQIAQTVVDAAKGRAHVFIQTGAMTQADTIALSKHAYEIGADGIGVITPVFVKMSDQGLVRYYQEIASSVPADFPVYLYAIPQNACNDISVAVAEEIARLCPNVVGIKYSAADFARMQRFICIRNNTFSVLTGPDSLFQAMLAIGGAGTVSGNSQVLTEHFAAIYREMLAGHVAGAADIQKRTNMLCSVLCQKNNIAAYKAVLAYEGVIRTSNTRAPMEQLTEKEENELIEKLLALEYKKVNLPA